MREYEAMFILRPDLQEEQLKKAGSIIQETIKKEKGEIISADKWSDRRTLAYELCVPATGGHAKFRDGIYYLANFKVETSAIDRIKQAFKLNEDILRVLITVKE